MITTHQLNHHWSYFRRFLGAGIVNTLLSLLVYQMALFLVSPVLAYAIAWLAGIVFLIVVYPKHVFRVNAHYPQRIMMIVIYGIVFVISSWVLSLLDEYINARFSIFLVIVFSTLLNFILLRSLFFLTSKNN